MDITLVTDNVRYTKKTIFTAQIQYGIADISQQFQFTNQLIDYSVTTYSIFS